MVTNAGIIETGGGENVVPYPVSTGIELVHLIRQGMSVQVIDRLRDSFGLSTEEVDRVIIPRKTLVHRRKLGNLTAAQSERVLRVARLLNFAVETFGSVDKAMAWIRRRTRVLDNEEPLSLLDTEQGARLVEDLLGRIGHGIAA